MEENGKEILQEQRTYSTFHSDEVQEIMGRQPAWILRWGVTILMAILVGILVACYFIEFPDTVSVPAKIISKDYLMDMLSDETGVFEIDEEAVIFLQVSVIDIENVAMGQNVNVKLNGSQYMKYGLVKGEVEYISDHPVIVDESLRYPVIAIMCYNLESGHNNGVPYSPDMDGTADIVTSEKRLFEQLASPITSVFKLKRSVSEDRKGRD